MSALSRWMQRRALDMAKRSLKYAGVPLRDPALVALFGTQDSTSGVDVTEDSALNFSAVWSAINLISGTVGMLPRRLVLRTGVRLPGGMPPPEQHIVNHILAVEPNQYATPAVFHQTHQAHCLTHGNAYQEVVREGGVPVALRTLLPDQTKPEWLKDGTLIYRVFDYTLAGRKVRDVSPADMIHVPGLGWDGTQGYSVIARARESVGLGLASERYGASYFGNGCIPGGVITHPGDLSPEAEKNIAADWTERHGIAENGHKLAVLDEGMKYTQVGIPPEDSQFLQTRQFQVKEIARWFRVPPHMLYESDQATYASVELQGLEFLTYTLLPWLVRWEQEYVRKLLTVEEQEVYEVVYDVSPLLRADTESRYTSYSTGRNGGWLTLNDILRSERMPLIAGAEGEQRLAPSTMRVLGAADPSTPIDPTVMAATLAIIAQLKPDGIAASCILKAAMPSATTDLLSALVGTLKGRGDVK